MTDSRRARRERDPGPASVADQTLILDPLGSTHDREFHVWPLFLRGKPSENSDGGRNPDKPSGSDTLPVAASPQFWRETLDHLQLDNAARDSLPDILDR